MYKLGVEFEDPESGLWEMITASGGPSAAVLKASPHTSNKAIGGGDRSQLQGQLCSDSNSADREKKAPTYAEQKTQGTERIE